jgi:L-fuculose-phosphate aldolase
MNARGYVASNDGNISVRLDDKRLLTTPKSVPKGFMTPDMMVIVSYEGEKLSGDREPSSELPMHLEVYRNRPDVNAVVHAHPPIATGFAVAGIPLTKAVLAEVITTLGSIPSRNMARRPRLNCRPRSASTSRRTTACCSPTTARVTCGKDVLSAYYKMETIEHFAKISFVARMLGNENLISKQEVERLQGLRGMYGIAAPAPVVRRPGGGRSGGRCLLPGARRPRNRPPNAWFPT